MTVTRPNPASPWVFDTRTLGRRPGSLKAWRSEVPAGRQIGLDVVAVPPEGGVDLDLRLESVAEGVLVSGTVSATAVGECSRCLDDLTVPVVAQVRELFAYPDSATAETTDEDEIPRLVDDLIDVEPLVRDEIVLALPLVPLCRPDCPGLCQQCGERLDDLEPTHSHEMIDPRWAALAGRVSVADPDAGGPEEGQGTQSPRSSGPASRSANRWSDPASRSANPWSDPASRSSQTQHQEEK